MEQNFLPQINLNFEYPQQQNTFYQPKQQIQYINYAKIDAQNQQQQFTNQFNDFTIQSQQSLYSTRENTPQSLYNEQTNPEEFCFQQANGLFQQQIQQQQNKQQEQLKQEYLENNTFQNLIKEFEKDQLSSQNNNNITQENQPQQQQQEQQIKQEYLPMQKNQKKIRKSVNKKDDKYKQMLEKKNFCKNISLALINHISSKRIYNDIKIICQKLNIEQQEFQQWFGQNIKVVTGYHQFKRIFYNDKLSPEDHQNKYYLLIRIVANKFMRCEFLQFFKYQSRIKDVNKMMLYIQLYREMISEIKYDFYKSNSSSSNNLSIQSSNEQMENDFIF